MHNKVVYRMARGLRRRGVVVLRFNFRAVGQSQGEHGYLEGEIEDARAALQWLRERYPDLPFELGGFSFGSRVITKMGCVESPSPRRMIAVGFPTVGMDGAFLEGCSVQKIFIQSTHDEHGPKAELEELYPRFAEPKRLIWISAEDHFFRGGLDELEEAVFDCAS
jgi:alpha/beta superfamily hydrolase